MAARSGPTFATHYLMTKLSLVEDRAFRKRVDCMLLVA